MARICPQCGAKKAYYAKACRACQVHGRPMLGRTGPLHPCWKGGREIDRDGYIRAYAPRHPWPRRNGYVLEHVMVMELSIGRRIRASECVHHKDGNRQNNDLSNLELLNRGQHSRMHRLVDTCLRTRDAMGRFA